MINSYQKHRFNHLRLYYRAPDFDQRFSGKYRCSFRNGPYITGELKIRQKIEKAFFKCICVPEKSDVILRKVQILQIINHLFHAGHNGISALFRHLTEEQIKISDLL